MPDGGVWPGGTKTKGSRAEKQASPLGSEASYAGPHQRPSLPILSWNCLRNSLNFSSVGFLVWRNQYARRLSCVLSMSAAFVRGSYQQGRLST